MELAPSARRDAWRFEKLAALRAALLIAVDGVFAVYLWDFALDGGGYGWWFAFRVLVLPASLLVALAEGWSMLARALDPERRPSADTRTPAQHVLAAAARVACGLAPIVATFELVDVRRTIADRAFLARHERELDAAVAGSASETDPLHVFFRDGTSTVIQIGSIGLSDSLFWIHDPTNTVTEPGFRFENGFWTGRPRGSIEHVSGPWYSWIW